MKLNNTAYVHKDIRLLCAELQAITGLELITELGEEFDMILFANSLSYIRIDYKNNTCFTLSYKLRPREVKIINEIMICCNWVEISKYYNYITNLGKG